MARASNGNDLYLAATKHVNLIQSKLSSKAAILYTGAVGNKAVYKRVASLKRLLRAKWGIEPDTSIEIITDVMERLSAPRLSAAKGSYKNLADFLFKAADNGDLDAEEVAELWSTCSAAFAKHSTVVAIISGRDIKLSSDFRDVELAVLHFRKNLTPEIRKKAGDLLKKKRRLDDELRQIDAQFHLLLKTSEKLLKRFKLSMNHSKFWQ
jgi:MoxR-like ATPase